MNKADLKIVSSSLENIKATQKKLNDMIAELRADILSEKETLENLQGELQEKYDDMSESAQEGDKGTELNDDLEKLGEIIDDLGSTDDALEVDIFDDVVEKYEAIVPAV